PGPIAIAMLEDIGWKVNYNVGIEITISTSAINIFPNPVKDELAISGNAKTIDAIEIFEMEGRKLFDQTTPHFPIDITALPSGILFCKLKISDQVLTLKFVKQ
ncbi:MAG: T9SS type A sorting domain-containing protein, partial [Chitinophagales bacterium]|nr:T9SS type A sorting domain-containing protein [Chitinophagales bacterium]